MLVALEEVAVAEMSAKVFLDFKIRKRPICRIFFVDSPCSQIRARAQQLLKNYVNWLKSRP